MIFIAEEGSFYGMELESSSLEELFMENQLVLDLKSMLGNNSKLKSVEIKEDFLEITIEWNFFSMSQGGELFDRS